jgi:FkbM family methyltransferase
MATSSPRVANAFLRYASPFSKLRTVPVLGNLLHLASRALVATDTLIWGQIENGLAADLWISVNPRTGGNALRGQGEPRVQQALAEHLRPGMTFYDLGANFGFFSLMAARLVGPDGHVFAFEPDRVMFLRLRQNLLQNGFRHAVAEERAVWCESTTLPFACADVMQSADRGLGHVSTDHVESSNVIPVAGVSLDDYCSSHPAPDFIKCDVEGAEYEVFQGAAQTLRQWHPTIVCEIHSAENHFALTPYFLDFGYTCYSLGPDHLLAVLE